MRPRGTHDYVVELRVSPRRFEETRLIMVRSSEADARRDAAYIYDVDEHDVRVRRFP